MAESAFTYAKSGYDRPLTSSRKRPKTPSRPLSPVDDTVVVETYGQHHPQDAPPAPVDSPLSSRRSVSLHAVGLGTYAKRSKERSGSVATRAAPPSPKFGHRLSRSISAGAPPRAQAEAQQDPEDEEEEASQSGSSRRPSVTPSLQSPNWGSKTSLRSFSSSFSKSTGRRASDAHLSLAQTMSNHSGNQNGYSPVNTYNHIVETANKRMATLDYLRKVHEGQVYYLTTVSYNSNHLSGLPSLHPARIGRRATNYLLLGSSLTPVLDFYASNPLDYLRVLAALLSEYDAYTQLSSTDYGGMSLTRNRMGQMLKSGMRGVKARRTSAADYSLMDNSSVNGSSLTLSSGASLADSMPLPPVHNASGHDFQYLQLPNLPFDPDFNTSFATLTDILSDAYSALLNMVSGPEACVPGLAEAFAKADKQMRKVMLGGMINEFGDNTRKEAKTEVSSLSRLVLGPLM